MFNVNNIEDMSRIEINKEAEEVLWKCISNHLDGDEERIGHVTFSVEVYMAIIEAMEEYKSKLE